MFCRWVLFAAGCVVRLIYVSARGFGNFEAGDTPMYDTISANLVNGAGFALASGATAFRVPGYPLFLAGVYWLFGSQNHIPVQILQIILGATVPLVLVAIGLELGDRRVAWFAGWVGVFHINLVFWVGYVLKEGLFIPLLMVAFYFVLRLRRDVSLTSLALGGLAMGAVAMTRPTSLPFLATVPLWLLWSWRRKRRADLWRVLVLLLFSIVVIIPWAARNYVVFKRIVPFSTGGVIALWYGTQWDEIDRSKGPIDDPTAGLGLDEFEARATYMRAFITYVREGPVRYALLAVRKGISFWSLYFPQYSRWHKAVNVAFFGPLFALSVVGIVSYRRKDREGTALLLLLLVSTTFLHMLTLVDYDGRYRVPIEAILAISGGMGLVSLVDRIRPTLAEMRP